MNEERARLTEGAELCGILKPSACIGFGSWSGVWNSAMTDRGKACFAEHRFPFSGAQQLRWSGEQSGKMVGM
jgi:hypothetical protein